MKLNRKQEILNEIARIHAEWETEFESQVEMDQSHSDPHDKDTMKSDYNLHYVARSASVDQEKEFQKRISDLYEELQAITESAPGDPEAETPVVAAAGEPEKPEGGISDSVDFDLSVNGSLVLMLVKHDFEEGTLEYREGGNWVAVVPDQELPALDDSTFVPVTGEATPIWDQLEGKEVTLRDFEGVTLDSEN